MESFIYKEINKASRAQDETKIKYYGPFASALSFIIHCSNAPNHNPNQTKTIYRGFQMPLSTFNSKFEKDAFVDLEGFTSCSANPAVALRFTITDLKNDEVNPNKHPVLLHIHFQGSKQFLMMNEDNSAFPEEDEVLL